MDFIHQHASPSPPSTSPPFTTPGGHPQPAVGGVRAGANEAPQLGAAIERERRLLWPAAGHGRQPDLLARGQRLPCLQGKEK